MPRSMVVQYFEDPMAAEDAEGVLTVDSLHPFSRSTVGMFLIGPVAADSAEAVAPIVSPDVAVAADNQIPLPSALPSYALDTCLLIPLAPPTTTDHQSSHRTSPDSHFQPPSSLHRNQ